jgi:aspartate-semialdehyde dehydrogenase
MNIPGEPKVAVVGATGSVGGQIVELLAARGFPASELKLFATEHGCAGTVESGGTEYLVEPVRDRETLAGFDIVFLAVPESAAESLRAARPGLVVIDLSAAMRAPSDDARLVAPGLLARERIVDFGRRGKVSIAHPAAQALASCLHALEVRDGFVAATVMLGASAGGRDLIVRTVEQTTDILAARFDLEEDETQRAFNIFMREHECATAAVLAAQVRALLGAPLDLALAVVAAPVLHGTGVVVQIPARADDDEAIARLRSAPGVLAVEEGQPLGTVDAVGQEAILVRAERTAAGISLWATFDNSRLAALCAVWAAESLISSAGPSN